MHFGSRLQGQVIHSERQIKTGERTTLRFVVHRSSNPPGEFTMGGTADEIEAALKGLDESNLWQEIIKSEAPQHKAILTQPIYLGVNEVTQAEYEKVMGANPSHFAPMGMCVCNCDLLAAAFFGISLDVKRLMDSVRRVWATSWRSKRAQRFGPTGSDARRLSSCGANGKVAKKLGTQIRRNSVITCYRLFYRNCSKVLF